MVTHFWPTASHRVNATRAIPIVLDTEAASVTDPEDT
jgi:hypothetical protein